MVGWPSESLGKIFDVIREKRQFYVYFIFSILGMKNFLLLDNLY